MSKPTARLFVLGSPASGGNFLMLPAPLDDLAFIVEPCEEEGPEGQVFRSCLQVIHRSSGREIGAARAPISPADMAVHVFTALNEFYEIPVVPPELESALGHGDAGQDEGGSDE